MVSRGRTSRPSRRSWAPPIDLQGDALVIDPGGSHVIVGGRFYLVGETFAYDDPGLLRDYVDPGTMRHRRHPSIWSLGDAADRVLRRLAGLVADDVSPAVVQLAPNGDRNPHWPLFLHLHRPDLRRTSSSGGRITAASWCSSCMHPRRTPTATR